MMDGTARLTATIQCRNHFLKTVTPRSRLLKTVRVERSEQCERSRNAPSPSTSALRAYAQGERYQTFTLTLLFHRATIAIHLSIKMKGYTWISLLLPACCACSPTPRACACSP